MRITNAFILILGFAILNSVCLQMNLGYANSSPAYFTIVNANGVGSKASFMSIQQAINEAENGSTIYVPPNVYYEHVVINKTVSLVGEDVSTTVIDGSNNETVVQILADNVSISNFTVQNSGWGWYRNGVYVYRSNDCKIENNYFLNNCHNIRVNCSRNSMVFRNIIRGTGYGIRLMNSINCTAVENNASGCIGGIHLENATNCVVKRNFCTQNNQGIRMYSPCAYNKILENIVFNNTYDGVIAAMPGNTTFLSNLIFHNNFINNAYSFIIQTSSGIIWDNGSEGNFWSRYNGSDITHDGIGDTQYIINADNSDYFPLMGAFSDYDVGYNGHVYDVSVISNSTIVSFVFEDANNTIRLAVNGTSGTHGFCRMCIPHILVMPEITVIIDNNATNVLYANYNLRDDGLSRWIYFTYEHSMHEIVIVPEFSTEILDLILVFTALCYSSTRLKQKRIRH